jgi:hypothetical protein
MRDLAAGSRLGGGDVIGAIDDILVSMRVIFLDYYPLLDGMMRLMMDWAGGWRDINNNNNMREEERRLVYIVVNNLHWFPSSLFRAQQQKTTTRRRGKFIALPKLVGAVSRLSQKVSFFRPLFFHAEQRSRLSITPSKKIPFDFCMVHTIRKLRDWLSSRHRGGRGGSLKLDPTARFA